MPQEWHVILRMRREELGLSQEELAHRTGLEQKQVSQIELGKIDPRLSTFLRLASALDLELIPACPSDQVSGQSAPDGQPIK